MLRATGYARMVTRDEPCTHGFPNVNVVRPCLSDVGRVRAANYKALLPRSDRPPGRPPCHAKRGDLARQPRLA